MRATLNIEQREKRPAPVQLSVERIHEINQSGHRVRRRRLGFTTCVVFGALCWIGQYVICLLQQEEFSGIAGFRVVRVKAGSQEFIDAMDCIWLSLGADLEEFVIIRSFHLVPIERSSSILERRSIAASRLSQRYSSRFCSLTLR